MRENTGDVKMFDVESFWKRHSSRVGNPWEMALETLFVISQDGGAVAVRLPMNDFEGCFEICWNGLEATICHNRICAILNSLKTASAVAAEPQLFDSYESSLKLFRQNLERLMRLFPPASHTPAGQTVKPSCFYRPAAALQFSYISRYYELLCRRASEEELRYMECLIAVSTILKEYGREDAGWRLAV